jgi:hypothetical protein
MPMENYAKKCFEERVTRHKYWGGGLIAGIEVYWINRLLQSHPWSRKDMYPKVPFRLTVLI